MSEPIIIKNFSDYINQVEVIADIDNFFRYKRLDRRTYIFDY